MRGWKNISWLQKGFSFEIKATSDNLYHNWTEFETYCLFLISFQTFVDLKWNKSVSGSGHQIEDRAQDLSLYWLSNFYFIRNSWKKIKILWKKVFKYNQKKKSKRESNPMTFENISIAENYFQESDLKVVSN